jgi:iron complex outermembrane receptor protein
MNALQAVSAEGVVLFGGKYSVTQFDASFSGPLFAIGEDSVQLAVGVDYRKEEYSFNGDEREAATRPVIIAAPFDDPNALDGVSRDVKAAYAEVLIPLFDMLEISGALRIDEYDGFGSTTNPKIAAKFEPVDWLLFRASYNTGFRVPTFNQIFNGRVESIFGGTLPIRAIARRLHSATNPQCQGLRPDIITRQPEVGPETSREFGGGNVYPALRATSARRSIIIISPQQHDHAADRRQQLNATGHYTRPLRSRCGGNLIEIDQNVLNAGPARLKGLESRPRQLSTSGESRLLAGLDGTTC